MSSNTHYSHQWADPNDFYMNSPQIISAVMATQYQDILSCKWTNERYNFFLNFATTIILAAQNANKIIILHSLKLVEMYMSKVKQESSAIESEYAIFLVAFRIAQKYHDDYYFPALETDLSLLTEMSRISLNKFEFKFLEKIDYHLTMNEIEHFQWELCCYGYYISFIPPLVFEDWYTHYLVDDYLCVEESEQPQPQPQPQLQAIYPYDMINSREL